MILIDTEDFYIIAKNIKISAEVLVMKIKFINKKLDETFKINASVIIKNNIFSNNVCIQNVGDIKLDEEYCQIISDVVLNNIKNMR